MHLQGATCSETCSLAHSSTLCTADLLGRHACRHVPKAVRSRQHGVGADQGACADVRCVAVKAAKQQAYCAAARPQVSQCVCVCVCVCSYCCCCMVQMGMAMAMAMPLSGSAAPAHLYGNTRVLGTTRRSLSCSSARCAKTAIKVVHTSQA